MIIFHYNETIIYFITKKVFHGFSHWSTCLSTADDIYILIIIEVIFSFINHKCRTTNTDFFLN